MKIEEDNVEFNYEVEFTETVGVDSEVRLNDIKQWLLVYRMNLEDFPKDIRYSCGIYSMLGK